MAVETQQVDAILADSKDAFNHIKSMAESIGYKILMYKWGEKREQIIREATTARANEKQIKNLARLQGFQEAVDMVRIILSNPPIEQDKFED